MARTTEHPILLRRGEVERRTGLSRSTIYEVISTGAFPAPVRIGKRAVAWRESDVTQWIESRSVASRKTVGG